MTTVKIRKVGNSLGLILPAELIERLNLKENDVLQLMLEQDGLHLTPFDPEFSEWAQAYRNTERKFRNTLRELAK